MASRPDRVFVTGALGSIGRAVADRYRALGAEVSGVDLRADEGLGVVAADVAEPGPWQRRAERADLVVHTAATVSFGRVDLWRPNVVASRNALDAAIRAGARRFLHSRRLGFQPAVGLEEGMCRTYRWLGEAGLLG